MKFCFWCVSNKLSAMIKMNYTSLFPAIICILCVFRISDGKTTVTPKVPVSRKPSTNFQSLPNRTKIITTRFGADGVTPEKQCQCTLFYLCNNENTVPLSSGQRWVYVIRLLIKQFLSTLARLKDFSKKPLLNWRKS